MASLVVDKRAYFQQLGYQPHPKQWLYHMSRSRFRAAVCGRRFGKSCMAARDLEPELMVPNRRYWIVGPCVDELTEIFTDRGWLRYDEVVVGDRTLSINPKTGLSEWDTVEKVLRKSGVHPVIRMEGHSFSSVSTPDHRWLTNRRWDSIGGARVPRLPGVLQPIADKLPKTDNGWTWRTTATLTADDRIPTAAPCVDVPTEPKYTDAFVELVAWIWTEGSLSRSTRQTQTCFQIHQSHVANPDKVSRIRRALEAVGASYYEFQDVRNGTPMTHFELNATTSFEFWKVFKSHKVVDPEFITSLTRAQLQLFVGVSVLGDGTGVHRETQCNIVQENEKQLFAVQMACHLLGIRTSLRQQDMMSYGKPGKKWVLGLLTQTFVNPKRAVYNAGAEGMRITYETYEGTVWCVTTRNGNWLSQRKGSVSYTANTYDLGEKEFRYLWQDMIIKLRFGRDKRVKKAYNKRSGEMYIEFPWQTRVEVRSAQHPETLVGDGLHGAIMSEAAKHRKDTWEQYIRAALSDFRGWATFVTTPEGFNWLYDLWMLGISGDVGLKDYESWRFPSWDNPIVYPGGREDEEIKLIERTTALEWFMQEFGAEFGAFVGKIYGEFDPTLHIKRHTFNPAWANYIAFDWGFTNPLAAVEFQVDPWDRVYVWREHYKSFLQLGEHIQILKNRQQPEGYHLDVGFGDAADPAAAMEMSTHFVGTWALPEAKENWRQGVDLVKKFLKPRDVYSPGGSLVVCDEYGTPLQEPWMFIDPSCINTIREFNNYRAADARPEVNPREAAKKHDDHALDAIRYGLMHIFELGCASRLSDVYDLNEFSDTSKAFGSVEGSGYFTTSDLDDM